MFEQLLAAVEVVVPDELLLVEPQPAAANASTPSSSAAVARKICRLPLIAVRLTRRLSHDSLTRVLQIHHAGAVTTCR